MTEETVIDVKLNNIEEKIDKILKTTYNLDDRLNDMEKEAAMLKGAIVVFGILWTVVVVFLGVVFEKLWH